MLRVKAVTRACLQSARRRVDATAAPESDIVILVPDISEEERYPFECRVWLMVSQRRLAETEPYSHVADRYSVELPGIVRRHARVNNSVLFSIELLLMNIIVIILHLVLSNLIIWVGC